MTLSSTAFFQGTEMPTTGWWQALWPDPAGVLAAMGVEPGMTVVDLCCGDGWFTKEIAAIAGRVFAIDIDPVLLDVVRRRLTAGTFIVGDAFDIASLIPERVDLVFMANAFHGVPDRPRLTRAVRATLRPDGVFAIVNWHRRPREETCLLGEPRGPATELRVSPETTVEAAVSGGMRLSRVIEIPPFHYGAVFRRVAV